MYIPILNDIFKSMEKKKHPDKLLYYPGKISIETGNICNLRCPLCPTNAEDQKNVEKGLMSFEDFKIIFDKISPFVKTIDLFNWGEPLLNKNIGDMIEYARRKKPGVRIFMDSNLNALDEGQIEAMVRQGLDCLKVSCDGATQKVYEKYRIGGDIEKVIRNVKKIQARKKELGRNAPRIIWKYLVFKHNLGEVEAARMKAEELGIGFEASGMRVDCGKEIFEPVADSVNRDREWIPEGTDYDNYKDLSTGKTFCEKPWRTLTVNWNGDVSPCGAVYDCSKYSFGNLIRQSFDQVWNGEKFREARRVISGRKDDADVICSTCKKNGFQYF